MRKYLFGAITTAFTVHTAHCAVEWNYSKGEPKAQRFQQN